MNVEGSNYCTFHSHWALWGLTCVIYSRAGWLTKKLVGVILVFPRVTRSHGLDREPKVMG